MDISLGPCRWGLEKRPHLSQALASVLRDYLDRDMHLLISIHSIAQQPRAGNERTDVCIPL